jgi:hypothetical protein
MFGFSERRDDQKIRRVAENVLTRQSLVDQTGGSMVIKNPSLSNIQSINHKFKLFRPQILTLPLLLLLILP